MIILGVILLIIGVVGKAAIIWTPGAHHHCGCSSPASEQLLAADFVPLRARRKARSLKVLLRTPVAASALSADAHHRVPELFPCADGRRRGAAAPRAAMNRKRQNLPHSPPVSND